MTHFLIKTFIKNHENTTHPTVRHHYGLLGGVIGIVFNMFLFTAKLIIGLIANSVSITADAINNLSDAGSSIVTLVGFKLAAKPADEDHPFGHARSEYISALVIAFLIMFLGVNLTTSSISKIFNPEPIVATVWTFIILGLSIVVKLWLYLFNKHLGTRINSTTLKATAADSLNDVVVTSGVLISTLIAYFTNVNLDGFIGLFVALFILYAGVGIIRDTINPLLGEAPDPALVQSIRDKIMSYPNILGLHDLVVHTYGPNRYFASVHVEVDANEHILVSHDLIDTIERDCMLDLNIQLVIHLDPIITDDTVTNDLYTTVSAIVTTISPVLSIHDFRVVRRPTLMNLIFDVEKPVDFELSDRKLAQLIDERIREQHANFTCVITIDTNYIATCINAPHEDH